MENVQKTTDPRVVDILISVAAFAVLLLLITILPMFMAAGIAYLTAVIIFISVISGAGLLVNRKAKIRAK